MRCGERSDGWTDLALSQPDGLDNHGVIPGHLAQQDHIVGVLRDATEHSPSRTAADERAARKAPGEKEASGGGGARSILERQA